MFWFEFGQIISIEHFDQRIQFANWLCEPISVDYVESFICDFIIRLGKLLDARACACFCVVANSLQFDD